MSNKYWVVYLVRCSDNSLYCGISNNLKIRLFEHNSGKGSKYTRSRRPVELVDISPEMTKSDALKLEYRIKRLPANKKISKLIKEGNQMTIAKDLQALNKDMKALGKKMDNLLKAVEKSEKAEAPKKLAGKSVKAKTLKKAPVKKAPLREKIAPPTATDQVLKIIKGSKKGVDTATLMKKTGFGQKKVWNILQRVYKQGRIKRVGKGLYAVT